MNSCNAAISLAATRETLKNVTKKQRDDAVHRLNVYKAFTLNEILKVGRKQSTLILLITSQTVDHRHEPVKYVRHFVLTQSNVAMQVPSLSNTTPIMAQLLLCFLQLVGCR